MEQRITFFERTKLDRHGLPTTVSAQSIRYTIRTSDQETHTMQTGLAPTVEEWLYCMNELGKLAEFGSVNQRKLVL